MYSGNGGNNDEDRMVEVMERIARDLEKVLIGIFSCAGLLGAILFVLILRLSIGR